MLWIKAFLIDSPSSERWVQDKAVVVLWLLHPLIDPPSSTWINWRITSGCRPQRAQVFRIESSCYTERMNGHPSCHWSDPPSHESLSDHFSLLSSVGTRFQPMVFLLFSQVVVIPFLIQPSFMGLNERSLMLLVTIATTFSVQEPVIVQLPALCHLDGLILYRALELCWTFYLCSNQWGLSILQIMGDVLCPHTLLQPRVVECYICYQWLRSSMSGERIKKSTSTAEKGCC